MYCYLPVFLCLLGSFSRDLNASGTWREYKIPMDRGGGVISPPPLPTGILYSPQFRSHQ